MNIHCYLGVLILMIPPAMSAQTTDDQLNQFWQNKQYSQIKSLFDANVTSANPDVALLYCAKIFFVLIDPDKNKAMQSAMKLKQIADGTRNQGLKELANQELTEVQAVPDAEFSPRNADLLSSIHSEFTTEFPNIEFGIRLRKMAAE